MLNKVDLSGCTKWNPEDQQEARKILREYADVFAKDNIDLGRTSVVKHKITLTEGAKPINECYRRVPPGLYDGVQKHLQEMMDTGAIWPSNSPWASTVVLVKKKNGKLCFCIDLKKLNSLIFKDTYSIPQIHDTLDCLQGAVWFTLLDLKSGYWQVEPEEANRLLTVFTIGLLRVYECEQMPFGLTNALATFQHLMETCLGHLQFQWCIIYLDDIIIFAATLKEHLERLCTVLSRLQAARLKLQPTNCKFFKVGVVYLGHKISKEGVQTDGHKVKAIRNWPVPISYRIEKLLGVHNLLQTLH